MSICFLFPGQSLAAHLRRRGCPILTVPPPLPSLRHPRPRRGRKEPTIKGRATEFHQDGRVKKRIGHEGVGKLFHEGKADWIWVEWNWRDLKLKNTRVGLQSSAEPNSKESLRNFGVLFDFGDVFQDRRSLLLFYSFLIWIYWFTHF